MLIFWLLFTIGIIILFSAVIKIHPLPVLLGAAIFFGVVTGMRFDKIITAISNGFGDTQRSIGLVIIAGTIIGVFMEKRGALSLLARKILQLTGNKRLPLAVSTIGFISSIAIFCDSAFVILIGLCREMAKLAKYKIAVVATILSMGLFATHCLVPPTPGPLAAVSILQADLGIMMLFSLICAILAAVGGMFYALLFCRNIEVADDSGNHIFPDSPHIESVQFSGNCILAMQPIVLPLFLILLNTVKDYLPGLPPSVIHIIELLGIPVVAVGIGAIVAVFGLSRCRAAELTMDGDIGKAVIQAAGILAITGAGGSFGEILRMSELKNQLPLNFVGGSFWVIILPILISAFLKTAQGSSTVAILGSAAIFAPLLPDLGLSSAPLRALTAVAVCTGGLMVSHTNDSYFWVVTQFSHFSVRQGLRTQTMGSLFSGLAATTGVVVIYFFIR